MISKEDVLKVPVKSTEEERLYRKFHRYMALRKWFIQRKIIRARKRGENKYTFYSGNFKFQNLFEEYFDNLGYSVYVSRPFMEDCMHINIYW